jgi:hypothetical protein
VKNGVQGKWRSLVAEFGGKRIAFLYVLHRLLDRISRGRAGIVPYRLVAQPIGNPALASVRFDSSTVVRRIAPDDPVIASFPRPRDVIERRFADGSECYVAFVKRDFAGHIWIARGRYAEDEIRCTYRIANPTIGLWDYDAYVQPAHRLNRTPSRLWQAVDDALAAEGAALVIQLHQPLQPAIDPVARTSWCAGRGQLGRASAGWHAAQPAARGGWTLDRGLAST